MNRRSFLKSAGALVGALFGTKAASAVAEPEQPILRIEPDRAPLADMHQWINDDLQPHHEPNPGAVEIYVSAFGEHRVGRLEDLAALARKEKTK